MQESTLAETTTEEKKAPGSPENKEGSCQCPEVSGEVRDTDAVRRSKKEPKKHKRISASGAVLCTAALLAITLYAKGGLYITRGDASQESIAANVARVAKLENQAPVDLDLEFKQKRQALLQSCNGILVDDLAAEQDRIMRLANWTQAQLRGWFSDAALVGDSLTLGAQSYGWLDESVYADKGARVSTAGELLDAVEAAQPSVVFLCFGVNDIASYKSNVSVFAKRYAACVQRLQASLPWTAVYVCAVFPPRDGVIKQRTYYKYLDDYNAALQKMCTALGAYYIDASFILKRRPEFYSDDGMHPKKEFFPYWLTYLADIAGLSEYAE